MGILAEIVVGVIQIVAGVLLEIVGYLIWGILEGMLTKAGGFLGGILVGLTISGILFACLSSAWLAGWISVGVMIVTVGLGLMIELAGESK